MVREEEFNFLGQEEPMDISVHVPNTESDGGVVAMFKSSSHPVAAVFHVCFKVAALVLYLFGSLFSSSFVVVFVLCVLALSFDFWTVKNITGRLMVRLRWWNDMSDTGQNVWRFESSPDVDSVSSSDYSIFWYSMYLNVVVWGAFAFLGILKFSFDWLLVDVIALGLGMSNIYGYWQCSKEAKQRVQEAVGGAIQQQALNAFSSSVSSGFTNMFSGQPKPSENN